MKLSHCLSIFAISAILASCAKEGPTGPQGPAGYDGVANINTRIYSVSTGGWTYEGSDTWTSTFGEPDISDNNVDAVEVYWSNSSNPASGWFALPVSDLDVTGDQLSYGFADNSITFSYYGNSNSPDQYGNTSTLYFKVTVIPPSVQVKYPHVNWKNASEVAAQVPEVQAALAK